jgi:hypothetical protein
MDNSVIASPQNELSNPLLGSEHQEEHDVEIAVPLQVEDDDDELRVLPTRYDLFVLWLVLPTLLFLQFGIAFWFHDGVSTTTHHLYWYTVNWSIVLFVVASYLFRRTLQDHRHERNIAVDTLLFLLPEIIMDVLLGMVLFGLVEVAFLTMVASTVGLSLYVVVQSLYTLSENTQDDDLASDCEVLCTV